jgi:hypothetical protein
MAAPRCRRSASQRSNFVGWDGSTEPFELELADRGGVNRLLDRAVDARTDQGLAHVSVAAEPRGQVRHRPDRAVVVSAFEADSAERRVASLDADAETELDASLVPSLGELPDPLLGDQRELDGLELVVLERDGVVEEDHDAVAGEVLERAPVGRDHLPKRLVVRT